MIKKILRTIKLYKAQFISMIFMFTIGIGCFLGFNGEQETLRLSRDETFNACGYSDYSLTLSTGEAFSTDSLDKIKALDGIDEASGFYSFNVSNISDTKYSSQLGIGVIEEYASPTKIYTVSGEEYSETSSGIYLSDKYASVHNINVDDTITIKYLSNTYNLKVLGLCKSTEFFTCLTSDQIMPDYKVYGYGIISPMTAKDICDIQYTKINVNSKLTKEELTKALNFIDNINILSKSETTYYELVEHEMEEGKAISSIVPVVFLGISLLTLVTTMNRIVKSERTQIGILKSLGFKDRKILLSYTFFGIFISILALILGLVLAFAVLRFIIYPQSAMDNYFDVIRWKYSISGYAILIVLLMIILIILVNIMSVKQILKIAPADSLKPYKPSKGKRLLIDKFKISKRLKFSIRWNLNDISRNKFRTLVALIGAITSSLLVFGCLAFRNSFDNFVDMLDKDIYLYETKIELDNNYSISSSELEDYDYSKTLYTDIEDETIVFQVFNVSHDYYGFIDFSQNKVNLSNDGIYISRRLYDKGYKIGDKLDITIKGLNKTYSLNIAGYALSPLTNTICLTFDYLNSIDNTLSNLSPDTLYTNLSKLDLNKLNKSYFKSIMSCSELLNTYNQMMELSHISITVLVILSMSLGFIVLYNLGVMNFYERYIEYATLKVIGFRDSKINKIITELNVFLGIVGIIFGIPLGYLMVELAIKAFTSNYEFVLNIKPLTYVLTIIFTIGIMILVSLKLFKKTKRIDMVESLKGID